MRVELNYGRGMLPVELPDGLDVQVIRKPAMPVLPDPKAATAAALAKPIGASPLRELARGRENCCILICDITRPVPNGTILPVLIRELLDAGMKPADIVVVVATGLHRPNEGAELAELVGDPWVLKTVRVENHFARNDADHVDLGTTKRGTRVKLDRRLVEADLRIATGLVEPHFMAGWSGGRKVIVPGVAHAETITRLHSAAFMEHPNAANCVLEGNPLHEEQIEVMGMLGGAFAVNTVIDDHRRMSHVNFGEIVASHADAVAYVRRYAEVPVRRRFATVVTSAAGYPLDKTYYQTVKGMVAPVDILAPGGDLIVASACSEGMGSHEYVEAQRRLLAQGNAGFLDGIKAKTRAEIDEWQTEMQLKAARVGAIHLYAEGLKGDQRGLTGVTMIDDVRAAIAASVARSGDRHVAVIPEGPYVVPQYRPQ
ncbi:MAG: nickel-dependent lactate racemase [Alphaproteobacteria bacterium]|nr:nickel-dependent lactate racemase [Alphaproteobacteria bacterium]